jgi:mycobactin polyketide synthetase MbtD
MSARLPDGRTPVVLSAHSPELIRTDAAALLTYLDGGASVEEVAAQLLRTRRIRRHRTVIRAADRADLITALRAVVDDGDHPLLTRSSVSVAGRLAFVFPGQGNQWPGMGAEAYRELAGYRSAADTCATAFVMLGQPSPLRYLIGAGEPYTEIEIEAAQFVHGVALAQVWQSCGIAPDLTVGHSLGEVAAAYLAGAITLPDAAQVIAARAGVVDLLPSRYAVAALGIGVDETRELIAGIDGWLELSVVNAGTSVAVSGDRDAVLAAVHTVAADGRFAREITVGFPVHTSILEPLRDGMRAQLPDAEFADTAVQFVGAAIGDVVAPGTVFADYWYGNLRDMVRFDLAVATATRLGVRSFVEISAHPALLYAITDVVGNTGGDDPAVLVGSGHRDRPLTEQLSANIVAAAAANPRFDWRSLVDTARPPLRNFPNAPMRAVHLWAAPEPVVVRPDLTVQTEHWRQAPLPPGRGGTVAVHPMGAGPVVDAVAASTGLVDPADAEVLIVIAPAVDAVDVPAAADAVAEQVGAGLLNYPALIGSHCRTVVMVTQGAERVLPDDPQVVPAATAVAAMHRSIGFEHPDRSFIHIDLPADGSAPHHIAEALLAEAGSGAVRVIDGRLTWWRREFRDAPPVEPWALDGGVLDEVVITGGAGTIGLQYARYLAERGARRIVLLSRRGADPTVLAELTARHGTVIEAPPCDVTDATQVAAVAAQYGTGASLLIHAAGIATFAPAAALTETDCADTFAAKLTGLTQLTEHWSLRGDARILLCSSVSGVWGGTGHAAYSAANRMLDVLAAQLRADGRHCVAVRWGLWQALGGASGIVDAGETAAIERSGLRPMEPAAAIAASLRDYQGDPLILSADTDRLRIFLASHEPARAVDPEQLGGPIDAAQAVRTELAAVLSIDAATVDLDTELFDLGVDSLLAIDLRKRLKRVIGHTVPLATLLGGITGSDLVDALGQHEPQKEVV